MYAFRRGTLREPDLSRAWFTDGGDWDPAALTSQGTRRISHGRSECLVAHPMRRTVAPLLAPPLNQPALKSFKGLELQRVAGRNRKWRGRASTTRRRTFTCSAVSFVPYLRNMGGRIRTRPQHQAQDADGDGLSNLQEMGLASQIR